MKPPSFHCGIHFALLNLVCSVMGRLVLYDMWTAVVVACDFLSKTLGFSECRKQSNMRFHPPPHTLIPGIRHCNFIPNSLHWWDLNSGTVAPEFVTLCYVLL